MKVKGMLTLESIGCLMKMVRMNNIALAILTNEFTA